MTEFPNSVDNVTLPGIDNYNFIAFGQKVKKIKPTFAISKTVEPKDFKFNKPGEAIVAQIDQKLKNVDVVLLTGAYQVGTTSVGEKWVSEKPGKRHYGDIQTYREKSRILNYFSKYSKQDLFIDEPMPVNGVFEVVRDFVKDNKKIVLRTHLEDLTLFKDVLLKSNITCAEVVVTPIKEDEMREYLNKKFKISGDDKIISFISKLSGGSLVVANVLSQKIVDTINFSDNHFTKENFIKAIVDSKELCNQWFESWDDQRAKNPEMLSIIPQPALRYFNIN